MIHLIVVGLQGQLLGLSVLVRDGALAGRLSGTFVMVQMDPGHFGLTVRLNIADGGEILHQLRYFSAGGQALHKYLHLR